MWRNLSTIATILYPFMIVRSFKFFTNKQSVIEYSKMRINYLLLFLLLGPPMHLLFQFQARLAAEIHFF